MRLRPGGRFWLALGLSLLAPVAAYADDPERPAIEYNRWQEDWSVLADPALRTEPLDDLKYIPFSDDGKTYVSLGADLRERFESLDAPLFGTMGRKDNSYLIDRAELHADLRIAGQWQVFVQVEDDRAPGKDNPSPADADRVDLEQAFVAYTAALDGTVVKLRVGRQEFGFDLQRFVSTRDGPNVRQAYDAAWIDVETGLWRIISFVSHPVQYLNEAAFDDYSDHDLALDGFRVERRDVGPGNLAVYYLRYERSEAHFGTAFGDERRNILDARYSGARLGIDWDLEAMGQQGEIGTRDVLAWAAGSRVGYRFADVPWQPHPLLQIDAASGSHTVNGTVGTFNPLFPNGSYFTLASLTGFSNLIHVKPILTFTPTRSVTLMTALGLQWRETTHDSIYVFPVIPIANSAGHGSAWSAAYWQERIDWVIDAHWSSAIELVHYQIGNALRRAGGHDSNYAGFELKFGW
jgi:hypothetical protein